MLEDANETGRIRLIETLERDATALTRIIDGLEELDGLDQAEPIDLRERSELL